MTALFKLGFGTVSNCTSALASNCSSVIETKMRRSGSWSCVRETADDHRQTTERSTFDFERSPDGAVFAGVTRVLSTYSLESSLK
jgi:hypothetical protein